MRASTSQDKLTPWEQLGTIVDEKTRICILFIYRIGLSYGVKLMCMDSIKLIDVMKIIAYDEGLLFGPFKSPDNLLYFTFLPKKPILVGYDAIRRVIRVVLREDAGRQRRRRDPLLAGMDYEESSFLYEEPPWP